MAEPTVSRVHRDDVDRTWRAASAELTTELRRLGRLAALTDVGADSLNAVAGQIAEISDHLATQRRSAVLLGDFNQGRTAAGVRRIGEHNVRVLPLEVEVLGACAVARYRPEPLLEGAPGLLHGGEAAWMMDCMCGLLLEEEGSVARTANLTLDYLAPTPLTAELTLRSVIERREGRKLWVRATIEVDDVVTVEARGLFITPRT